MKKIISILFCLLMVLPIINASEPMRYMPPYPGGIGQNHYYSVVFDEEGEAVVAAKLSFHNPTKQDLNSIIIEIPGTSVRLINALQEAYEKERTCVQWNNACERYADEQTCTAYDPDGKCIRYERLCIKETNECLRWQERVINWKPKYFTLDRNPETLSKSVRYEFRLPEPIKEQETGTIILYYKTESHVKKSLGIYYFDFETVKQAYDVPSTRVAINVVPDLYLKGGESNIDYRPAGFGAMELATSAKGVESDELRTFSNTITYQRGYVKTASGLDPWESFHVKGAYASSWLLLYKRNVFVSLLVISALLGGIFLSLSKIKKFKFNEPLRIVLTGFCSALGLSLFWFFVAFIMRNIHRWVGWRYNEMVIPLIVLLIGVIILAIIFGPPIYMGIRYKPVIGLLTLVSTIAWLIVFVIVIVALLSTMGSYPVYKVAEMAMIG